jgi:4-hydroxy-3-polyprenylbenzoate decarboxylase
VDPDRRLTEGPFGDHLGYYSMAHPFPVLRVTSVHHRRDAIWPFTVVGRPPQEDTVFGELIHELTGPAISTVIHGIKAVHAVDAAGVHPLLFAIGSERYTPYQETPRPQEILTQANAILGQGQLSLAKYLWIANDADDPRLNIRDAEKFLAHMLARVDWRRDLHFQTCTTIDTLDYSGGRLNEGSKVVVAAVGNPIRGLPAQWETESRLPAEFTAKAAAIPGCLVIQAPPYDATTRDSRGMEAAVRTFCESFSPAEPINAFPLIVLVDDASFASATLRNFLWVTFTRSDPASDIHGIATFMASKHWGCEGSLVIDARLKPHHAPPLEEDPDVARRVDRLGTSGGPLAGII